MRKVFAISINTFKETIRDKILYNLLIFALLLIISSIALGELTVGEHLKIIVDLGLASISIFGTLIAVFVGIGLVYKEIDRRTIYTIITKPVTRPMLLLGKLGGLAIILALNVIVMSAVLCGVLIWFGSSPTLSLFQAIVLIYVELLVIMSAALLFSSFSTPTLSAIFTLSIWLIGHLAPHLKFFGERAKDPAEGKILMVLYQIVPNLDRFNMKSLATYGESLQWGTFGVTILLGMLYVTFFFALGSIILMKKDLK